MHEGHLKWIVEFTIREGKLETFENLAKEIAVIVKQNEPDTKCYQWYFNDEKTKCVVSEWYESSEAALAHLHGKAATTFLPKLLEVSNLTRFEVYGDPNEDLKKALANFGTHNFHFFIGFIR